MVQQRWLSKLTKHPFAFQRLNRHLYLSGVWSCVDLRMNTKMTSVHKRLDHMLDNQSTFHSQHTWREGVWSIDEKDNFQFDNEYDIHTRKTTLSICQGHEKSTTCIISCWPWVVASGELGWDVWRLFKLSHYNEKASIKVISLKGWGPTHSNLPTPCQHGPGLDHICVRLGPAPPLPPSLPGSLPTHAWELFFVGNQCDNTWLNFKTFKLTSLSLFPS